MCILNSTLHKVNKQIKVRTKKEIKAELKQVKKFLQMNLLDEDDQWKKDHAEAVQLLFVLGFEKHEAYSIVQLWVCAIKRQYGLS